MKFYTREEYAKKSTSKEKLNFYTRDEYAQKAKATPKKVAPTPKPKYDTNKIVKDFRKDADNILFDDTGELLQKTLKNLDNPNFTPIYEDKIDPVLRPGGVPIGQNIIQPYKEDNIFKKVGKGIVNYGLGTINRVLSAPQQALMNVSDNTNNLIKGKPQNWGEKSFANDILEPTFPGAKNHPIISGLVETALDPTTYVGGGIVDDLAKTGRFGKSAMKGTKENLAIMDKTGQTALKKKAIQAPTSQNKTLNISEGNLPNATKQTEIKPSFEQNKAIGKPKEVNLQKFSLEPSPNLVKKTHPNTLNADGPIKERGFSRNVKTDSNMNDEIRDSLTKEPLKYEQLTNKATLSKATERFDKGYDNAVRDWNNSLNTFRADDVPLSRLLANEAVTRGDTEMARKIVADVAEKLTIAGQFSQAARILRQTDDPGAFMAFMQRQINKLNVDGSKQYGKKWTGVSLTDDELTLINGMERVDEVARDKIMEEIYNRVAKQIPVTKMEKFDAWRRMAMLLNPKTHVRNITGNAIMTVTRKVSDTIGAGMEKVFLKPGNRTKSFGWSFSKNLVETVEKEWQASKKELMQEGRFDIESLSVMNREKPVFKTKALEKANEFSKWALNAGDAPFLKRAYKDALGQYMKANKLVKATDVAKDYATRRAFEATFKQTNMLSSFISKAKQTKAGRLVEAAIPFSKTPTNIAIRAFEYSPAGLTKLLFSKGKTGADIIETISKGMTGVGVAGLGYLMANSGWARAERSQSKNTEAILQQMGEQPFSITTPQGSFTFDWAQPFAVPFFMGVTVFEELNKKDNVDVEGIADSLSAGTDTIFNMSMLKNIKQLFGGSFGSVTEQIAGLPVSYFEQAFPSIAGQTARTIDDTKRSTYASNPLEKLGNELKAKTPGLSKTLEPNLDIWGNEQKQGGAIQQYLSPGYWKDKSDDPVTNGIVDIYKSTKNTLMLPKVAPISFAYKNKEIILTPQQITHFQRSMGQANYLDIKEFLDGNNGLSALDKAKYITKIVNKNYDNTKELFIPKG